MIMRSFKSKAQRTALACGVSLVAMTLVPTAQAQQRDESAVYFLRHNSETADGASVMSTTEDIAVGRSRAGDKSIMLFDHQGGAITFEHAGHTAVLPLVSNMGVERAFQFNYADQSARGNDLTAFEFNAYVRPLLEKSPPLGADASWSTTTDVAALGLAVTGDTPIRIELKRTYFNNNGEDVVLVEFFAPAFTYTTRDGEVVVQWARGFAVTDLGFARIHLLTTQHRASIMSADGSIRPFSERASLHSVEADGSWSMSFDDAPEVQAALDRLIDLRGDTVAITTDRSGDAPLRNVPSLLAKRLNMAAFGIAENGGNFISIGGAPPGVPPLQLGGPVSPELAEVMRTGIIPTDPNHPYHLNSPFGPPTPEQIEIMQQFLDDNPTWFTGSGSMHGFYSGDPVNDEPQRFQSEIVDTVRAMLEALTEQASSTTSVVTTGGPPSGVTAFRGQAEDALRSQGMSDQDVDRLLNALLQPDRTRPLDDRWKELDEYYGPMLQMLPDWADGQRPDAELTPSELAVRQLQQLYADQADSLRIEDRLTTAREKEAFNRPTDDPEFQAAAAAMLARHQAILNARYERMLQQLRLTEEQLPAGIGSQLVPGWIDPDSADAEEYRRLVAELQSEMGEVRRILERDETQTTEQPKLRSGFGEREEFYTNNAFNYTSMVGVVATDLSRWQEWLMTQNMRELERLADNAGYPNLASALADAQNILRQSQDPGYRQWALQAPSCNGPAGCGPSYLERWHMKTSIVALGDILNDSRDVFSTGGFSDIGISSLNLSYLLRDNALEDGDIVRVRITQFGRVIYEGQISLTNLGQIFNLGLGRGVASLEIFAVNEGTARPNTAQITVDDVVRGQATQSYSLATGETATLRIEAGAKPGPAAGTSGAPQ